MPLDLTSIATSNDLIFTFIVFFFLSIDERMHHYQRRRASITGLMVELRKIIETGRLVVVVMTRLVRLSSLAV
jgi:hypothetical protein